MKDRMPALSLERLRELPRRLGVLFVLALQSDDTELREAAAISRDELGMKDGPVFLPVLSLVEMAEGKPVEITEEMVRQAAQKIASMLALRHGFILPEVSDYDDIARACLSAALSKEPGT